MWPGHKEVKGKLARWTVTVSVVRAWIGEGSVDQITKAWGPHYGIDCDSKCNEAPGFGEMIHL